MNNQYRIRNWSEYNAGLKLRGSITFWLSTDVIVEWLATEKTRKRGASATYNKIAIALFILFGFQFKSSSQISAIFIKAFKVPIFKSLFL